MIHVAKSSLWQRLTAPHPSIKDVERYRQARLLSTFLIVAATVVIFIAIWAAFDHSRPPDVRQATQTAVLILAGLMVILYWLNRAGKYSLSTYGFITILFVVVHLPLLPASTLGVGFTFAITAVLLISSILLTFRATLLLSLATLGIQLLFVIVAPKLFTVPSSGPFLVTGFIAALMLAFFQHRTGVERERQAELQAANAALRESEASLERRVAERTRDLEVAADVSRQITTMLDLKDLLRAVAERTKAGFKLYHVSVFLHDAQTQSLTLEAGTGTVGERMKAEGWRFAVQTGKGLVPEAARGRTAILINDVNKEARYSANSYLPQTRSELALPMIVGNKLIGVLDLQSELPERFYTDDARIMTSLAEQIAIAVNNATLFQNTENARQQAEVIDTINGQMTRASDEHEITTAINQFGATDSALNYFHFDSQNQPVAIETVARQHNGQPIPLSSLPVTVFPISQFPALDVIFASENDPIFVEDTATDSRLTEAERQVLRGLNTSAMLLMPLKSNSKWQAVMSLSWDKPRKFDQDLRILFTKLLPRLADNVAARRAYLATEAARKEIEKLYAEQVAVAEQLREVDNVKSRFLASMSHELRTPLNAVLNFTKFVSTGMLGPVNEKQVDALNKTIDSGRHLLSLINDVLDITKIESKMLNLFVETDVNLQDELVAVLSTTETLLADKPVTLIRDIDLELPLIVGDRRRIRQIMLNLVSNACKFTDTGSITVSAHVQDDVILLFVKDTGPGIAPEDHDLIFESFRQTHTGLSQGGGTGLGLAIARRLAEAHGGRLWLKSTPGEGATFFVQLPVQSEALRQIMLASVGA